MILLIDNYDSFSYNLYQLVGTINSEIRVIRNDEMTPAQIKALQPSHIILSPGPGKPKDAGICEDAVRYFQGKVPILGVCLGHQAICETYGATVSYARQLMHGKQSEAVLTTHGTGKTPNLFEGLPERIVVARYHSLVALPETIPDELSVTAVTDEGEIMAVAHREYPVYGLQFHPESILTKDGIRILQNFLTAT